MVKYDSSDTIKSVLTLGLFHSINLYLKGVIVTSNNRALLVKEII